jgi:hypothetical protein
MRKMGLGHWVVVILVIFGAIYLYHMVSAHGASVKTPFGGANLGSK